jgi:hypothetical protein
MGTQDEPHFEIPASELAAWLERQGRDSWWSVDGDPLLMGRVRLPCAAEDLARAIREIGEPLLVLDKYKLGDGRLIFRVNGDGLAAHFAERGLGKSLCESDTWLDCSTIDERFRRISPIRSAGTRRRNSSSSPRRVRPLARVGGATR